MTGFSLVRLVLLVLPLGLDTFALSTVLGVTPMPARTRLRLALTFAAAEGLMPALGLVIGLPLGNALGRWSVYVAGAVIFGVGVWMWLKEHGEDKDDDDDGEAAAVARAARTAGWGTLGLALSISLDELAVGFSFGVLGFPLIPALVVIAAQALLLSLVGQWIGRHAGERFGEGAEHLVGPALCALGLFFVVAQLAGLPL